MNIFKVIIILGPVVTLMVRNSIVEYYGEPPLIYNALFNCLLLLLAVIFHLLKYKIGTFLEVFIKLSLYIYVYYLFKYTVLYIPFYDYFILERIYNLKDIIFNVNLLPFKSILGSVTMFHNIGNLFLLFPLGFYLPILDSKLKMKKLVFMGFLTTLFIETIQFIVSTTHALYEEYPYSRSADIDDIIFNFSGYMLGCIVSFIILHQLKKFKNGYRQQNGNFVR